MPNIKRYNASANDFTSLHPDPNGVWVKYRDVFPNAPKEEVVTPTKEEAAGTVALKFGWYIDHAMREYITTIERQVAKSRITIDQSLVAGTTEHTHRNMPHGEQPYLSLEAMADHLEHTIRDFKKAFEALKAAGIN